MAEGTRGATAAAAAAAAGLAVAGLGNAGRINDADPNMP